jgi:uncharacterized Tic20 family protein
MSTQPTEPPPSGPPPVSGVTPDERTWGTMAHVSSLIAMFVGGLMVLGPLIVWLVKKNESAYVAHHAREALNFQLSLLIVGAVLFVAGFFTCGIGWALLGVVWVCNVILSIIGAVRANEGQLWTYPFSIRLVT